MDYDQDNELEALERILIDSSVEPIMLSIAFLKFITNNFSQVIGIGGFGVVYMGLLRNGKVAVKELSQTNDIIEGRFKDELICLIKVKHKNIVRFLGYCSDTQEKAILYEGRYVLAEERRRFLCFEYVPNKSLHDYLKDETHGREWDTQYQLIEGICEGLCYLHNEEHINHLDLKPENILLDADMVPKITDFGLSRRFSRQQSRIITENIRGTPPYIAPEYWNRGEISFKTDIYSLGIIIIKLLRGSNESFEFEDWHKSLDTDCPKVKECIRIAQLCVNCDPYQRPTINHIIDMLNQKETPIPMVSLGFCHLRNNSRSTEEQRYRWEREAKKGGLHIGETAPDVGCPGTNELLIIPEPVSPGTEILGDAAQDAGRGDVFRVEDERVPSLPNMPEDIQEINAQLSPVVKEKFTNTTLPISLYKIPSDSVTYTLQESSHSMQLIRIDNGNLKSTLEVKKTSPAGSWETSKQLELDLYPLELHFPFEPNKLINCPVTLTNKTDNHIGVWITPTSSYALHYYFRSPRSPTFEMLEPHSTSVLTVTLRKLLLPPLQDRGKFEVLMVAMRSEQHLKNLKLEPSIGKKLRMDSNFVRRVEELGGQLHRKMLIAVICEPVSRQAAVTYQTISTRKFGGVVYSLDVHPTETWILMGHGQEHVSIWNYQTKERVMAWQAATKPGMVYRSPHFSDRSAICSAKFIARKQWFAVGDGYGCIYVYAYTTKSWVHRFEAHRATSASLLLAVHPTFPFLLSASHKENLIKLWDWDQRWVCTRKFCGHTSGVDSFRFNPREINMFVSVANDNTAKVWNIDSSDPVNTLPMVNPYSVDFFSADSKQHFLVTCSTRTKCIYIWDLDKKERVHSLGVSGQAIQDIAFHPALPILVTRLSDGTVCLWDATTYRLMEMVHLTDSPVRDMVFIGTKEVTRLMVGCTEGIAIMEINFPAVRTGGGGSENAHHIN